jgi:DHA1 family bicyclomycin/chloramphenicol resistance-like MFS transporter
MSERLSLKPEKQSSNVFIQIIIYILYGLGPLTGNVILVLFGVLSSEFGVPPTNLLIAVPAFMFPFAIVQLFSGAISDVKGRFPVIIIGLIVFAVGMAIATTSTTLIIYVIANICGGIGFGFVNPVLIALITDITPSPKIPQKLGLFGAVASLGVGLGPLLAGQLAIVNWRYIYIIFALITLFGIIGMLVVRKEKKAKLQQGQIKTFLKHLSQEIRRIQVILMILFIFLASMTYIAILIWTSQAFTGIIPENITGLAIGMAGIMGAIAGIIIGFIIQKKGIKYALIFALIAVFVAEIILLIIGNSARVEVFIPVSISLSINGVAGGALIPSAMYYSQSLSIKRRGALAGLVTAGQFTGIALVPIIYNGAYHIGGIQLVYIAVSIVSLILLSVAILLYYFSKKVLIESNKN